jgi:hypothetical protein
MVATIRAVRARRPRGAVRIAVVAAAAAFVLLAAPTASVARTVSCKSTDLRFPFQPGGPKSFGVFRLRIDGGRCATAHRVAKDWKKRFEANLRAGHDTLPRSVDGFTFTSLPVKAAQTFRMRGRKGKVTIRFDYVVPNG